MDVGQVVRVRLSQCEGAINLKIGNRCEVIMNTTNSDCVLGWRSPVVLINMTCIVSFQWHLLTLTLWCEECVRCLHMEITTKQTD